MEQRGNLLVFDAIDHKHGIQYEVVDVKDAPVVLAALRRIYVDSVLPLNEVATKRDIRRIEGHGAGREWAAGQVVGTRQALHFLETIEKLEEIAQKAQTN